MRLDRRLADEQPRCDLGVRRPTHDLRAAPRARAASARAAVLRGGARRHRPACELLDHTPRHRRREQAARPPRRRRIATTRSSSGVSLSRNPDAPTRSARKTYSSRSNVVRTSTRDVRRRRRRSSRSPRGRPAPACGCPSRRRPAGAPGRVHGLRPVGRLGDDLEPLGPRDTRRNPSRTSGWSSASRTRIGPLIAESRAAARRRRRSHRSRGPAVRCRRRARTRSRIPTRPLPPPTSPLPDAFPGRCPRCADSGPGRCSGSRPWHARAPRA